MRSRARPVGRTVGGGTGTLLLLALAAAPAFQAVAAPPVPAPAVVERVVAVVDERPLLLSDVQVLAAVRGLDFDAAREAAIDERLMHSEASRLAQAEVSPEEERAAVAGLLEQKPELRELAAAELARLAHRQLAILKYVEFRFRPQVRVSDDDVRKTWEAEEVGRPSGQALEDAAPAIRERLERRALDQRIEDWVNELRSRAEVRLVDAPAR